jgi:short-subunit dehydrogenase
MSLKLKPLDEQVVVITGATSGIGLATAEAAVAKGAAVVLAGRSERALGEIAGRLQQRGGQAAGVVCDVCDRAQVDRLAEASINRFGRIDTWVNNAGVSIYGWLEEVNEEDSRKLFDTNFWGVYNGSLAALPHLRRGGGALINVGSEVSDAVIPLQGMYSASKHAVKGLTDALRVEVQEVHEAPVSITLIQPTAVNTPYPQHARNYMPLEAKLPEPQIEPQKVAEAILDAATSPTRSTKVGAMAKLNTAMFKLMPGMAEKMSAKYAEKQHYDERPRNPEGALYQPSEATGVVAQTHGTGGVEP